MIIEDDLSIHVSRETNLAFAAWPEVRILFIPIFIYLVKLIQPWWKQLGSLAPK